MPKKPKKKKIPSWLKWLAIIVGSFVTLLLSLALIGWLWFCNLRNTWTVKERKPLPEIVVSKEDINRLQPTYRKIRQAFSGKAKGETTVVIESDDLDKFMAVANECRPVQEVARFRVEDDKIVVTADVDLNQNQFFKGRYLSGDFTWDVEMDEKAWHFVLTAVKVEDRLMPSWFIDRINKNLESKEDVIRNQLAPDWTRRLKSLTVKDGKVTIVIK